MSLCSLIRRLIPLIPLSTTHSFSRKFFQLSSLTIHVAVLMLSNAFGYGDLNTLFPAQKTHDNHNEKMEEDRDSRTTSTPHLSYSYEAFDLKILRTSACRVNYRYLPRASTFKFETIPENLDHKLNEVVDKRMLVGSFTSEQNVKNVPVWAYVHSRHDPRNPDRNQVSFLLGDSKQRLTQACEHIAKVAIAANQGPSRGALPRSRATDSTVQLSMAEERKSQTDTGSKTITDNQKRKADSKEFLQQPPEGGISPSTTLYKNEKEIGIPPKRRKIDNGFTLYQNLDDQTQTQSASELRTENTSLTEKNALLDKENAELNTSNIILGIKNGQLEEENTRLKNSSNTLQTAAKQSLVDYNQAKTRCQSLEETNKQINAEMARMKTEID
ncbi:hypothetical protein BDV95DRAFT_671915 [Massariosphaeria phaeospora]|uniref:Uncharacterized protein n=1 Tax=Massariosphaeria phaeospora TaxID=100035 RepID=A0A7C8M846_9PLEO|nr:hypothetical protein BDV95DRAFT_671915 [Massariosphaeria phaeospora]